MTPATYNFKSSLRGDTIPAKIITATRTVDAVTEPIDLTNYSIKMDIVLGNIRKSLIVGDGITVTDAVNGEFRINSFSLPQVGVWSYDIQFSTGTDVETYIKGTINILQDVTK